MSHTYKANNTNFICNSDFSGDVTIDNGEQSINIPLEDLKWFAFDIITATCGNSEISMKDRYFNLLDDNFISDNNFDFDAGLRLDGDFESDTQKRAYAEMIANALNEAAKRAKEPA